MPGHRHRKPLKSGYTLLELVVGLAAAGIVAMATALLFKAGIVTYNYNIQQNAALSSARDAFNKASGGRSGMLWSSQSAQAVQSLSATSLAVISTSAVTTSYTLTNGTLIRAGGGGSTMPQAASISALAVNYYNMASSGLITESTAAASASMVTALMSVVGNDKWRTYYMFSGTRLRNHP